MMRFGYKLSVRVCLRVHKYTYAYIHVLQRLKVLRRTTVCTSQTLQRELAKVKGVAVSAWTVRRHLGIAGFSWLPRSRKRKRVVANKGGASGK